MTVTRKILNDTQETLVAVERHWLTSLQISLARFSATVEDREALENSIRQLDELFLLVVVGEFNAGKSAFLNALFGQRFLEEGVTPTTSRINLLKHGDEFERVAVEPGVDVFTVPASILREIDIVDTPGTNAINREHEALTQEFIPRSDMVLFVTSVDRPFTESERAFLERIRQWGKKVVVVLNKIDILDNPADIERIEDFIKANMQALLDFTPEVFPISAKLAFQARQNGDVELLTRSRLPVLEDYVLTTLDAQERIRLKLSNPLGVGMHLIEKYVAVIDRRLTLLQEDFQVMSDVDRQLEVYREDMSREFRFRLADVDNVLHEFEGRGITYFDATMRLTHLPDLINKSKLQEAFACEVVGDAPETIAERVNSMIDWLVASNLTQWQAVMAHINSRREKHAERIVGQIGSAFEYDRSRLIETVSHAAERVLENYDKTYESVRVAESLQIAVAETAAVEVGAIGIGAAIVATTAADVTGILAASVMAVLGLLVIPTQKRRVKKELHEKIAAVRAQLIQTLTDQFERELKRALDGINDTISPYTRFIRSERKYLEDTRAEFVSIQNWLERQKLEVDAL